MFDNEVKVKLNQEKRAKAKQNKQLTDMNDRKKKTFNLIRPQLIREYKQTQIQKSMKKRRVIRKCKLMILMAAMSQILKNLKHNVKIKEEIRRRERLSIWGAARIKLNVRRFLKKRGSYTQRQVCYIRQRMTLHGPVHMLYEARAANIMYNFLYDLQKRIQLALKMKLVINRVIQIQRQARIANTMKVQNHQQIERQLHRGLGAVQQALIATKQDQYKAAIDAINMINGRYIHLIKEVAKLYLLIPLYIHTINIIRWHGVYRNHGKYNNDTYLSAIQQIEIVQKRQQELKAEGEALCPTKFLRELGGQGGDLNPNRLRRQSTMTQKQALKGLNRAFAPIKMQTAKAPIREKTILALLSVGINRKLEVILPADMEHDHLELSETLIQADFQRLNLQFDPLSPLLQPAFSLKPAYPGGEQVLDLIHIALGWYRQLKRDGK